MKSIDAVLHLSNKFGLPASEPGIVVVEFIFAMAWQLLDASLEDEGLLNRTLEQNSMWATTTQEMEIDGHGIYDEKWTEHNEILMNANTVMAVEIIGELLRNKITSKILFLARRHLYVLILLVLIIFENIYVLIHCLEWSIMFNNALLLSGPHIGQVLFRDYGCLEKTHQH